MARKTKTLPTEPSTAKTTFNVAVQTMRYELLNTITEPMTLTPDEVRTLAMEVIRLKQDVHDWKEKWQYRKDLMADAKRDASRAVDLLKSVLANLNVTDAKENTNV